MINRMLIRGSLRFYWRHRWQAFLILAGIALGVGVVVAVDMANQSARRALAVSVETVSGGSTHRIVGGPTGVPQQLLTDLRRERGIHASAPVILDYVSVGDRTFTVMGIDPVSEIALDRYGARGTGGADFTGMMTAGGLYIASEFASEQQLQAGDRMPVAFGGKTREIEVSGLLHGDAVDGLMIGDIATVQVLLERGDTLDRIDLVLSEREAAELSGWLPAGLSLVAGERRDQSLRQMTDTFHLNLTAMSLLALLVGGLLIYNTVTFSVLQRRRSWGIFRGLGGSRSELSAVILLEAAAFGILGTAMGIVIGIFLASGLVRLVLRTVDDLYFVLTVTGFSVAPLSILKGLILGIGVSVLSALAPAYSVGRSNPAPILRGNEFDQQIRTRTTWLLVVGLGLLAAGTLLATGTWLATGEGQSLTAGFVALALQVVGFCGVVPALVNLLITLTVRVLNPFLKPVTRLALLGIRTSLSRTGMAVAALSVAVAATVGMGIMVTSFRGSLETWLEQTLGGDIYVSVADAGGTRPGEGIPSHMLTELAKLEGVSSLGLSRYTTVESELGALDLIAVGPAASNRAMDSKEMGSGEMDSRELIATVTANISAAFAAGEGILVSEPLARHKNLAPGDSLEMVTREGLQELKILGVFRDYRSTRGMAVMALDHYRRLWDDPGVSGAEITLDKNAGRRAVLEAIRSLAATLPMRFEIRSSAEIRERSMAVFEQTFTVTRALRLLTIIVAFVGVLGALMLLQLERMRELALLRTLGMTGRQVARLVLTQTLAMGLLAGFFALPLGLMMAEMLIHVINVRAFGWTLDTHLPAGIFFEAMLLALAAALLAGVYPALRVARVDTAKVLRSE